jgi:acetyl-CoA carboxylase biotin carboxyl carrier protein
MELSRLKKDSWDLSEDEVRQVSRIIETLNQSTFDYLQIELGALKLTLSKGQAQTAGTVRATAANSAPAATHAAEPAVARPAAATEAVAPEAAQENGAFAIVAPLVGRFYLQPEPGAPPFVTVGSEVSDDTTVGLIEVMKTFNAVHAGVTGIITEICAEDTALVEYGQILFRAQPKG